MENNVIEDDFDYEVTDTRSDSNYDAEEILPDLMELPQTHEYEYDSSDNTIAGDPTLDYGDEYSSFAEVEEDTDDDVTIGDQCPGGDLESCVDVCPGQFGAKVFGLCVASCGKRCP